MCVVDDDVQLVNAAHGVAAMMNAISVAVHITHWVCNFKRYSTKVQRLRVCTHETTMALE